MVSAAGFRLRVLLSVVLSAALALTVLSARQVVLDAGVPGAQGVIKVGGLERLVGAPPAAGLPAAGADWRPIALPDDWLQSAYPHPVAWYRYPLNLNVPPGQLWGLLIENVNLNAAVYLNGKLVGQQGRVSTPIARNWGRSLLYSIPSGLLQNGRNELQIMVACFPPGHGLLGKLQFGPRELLVQTAQRSQFYRLEIPRFIVALCAMMGLVIGGIWFLRRQDTEYGWFALISLFAALHSLKYFVVDTGVNEFVWDWFLFTTFIGLSFSLYFFLMRFRRLGDQLADRIVAALWVILLLVLSIAAVLQSLWLYSLSVGAVLVGLATTFYAMSRVLAQLVRTRSAETYWIVMCVAFLMVIVCFDVAHVFGLIERTPGELSVYFLPLFLGTFGGIMLFRFVAAMREREQILFELEDRVTVATDRIVDLERASALAEQRESIMRDMHDGVGGHLVSSLALLAQQPTPDPVLKDVLHGALTDLRLMIDSLDAASGNLGYLLGALRDRMEPILDRAGFAVFWELDPVSSVHSMSPHHALQIMRILQEALANAIKHAGARQLRVAMVEQSNEQVIICTVEDDGVGFVAADVPIGRGLLNMRRRAESVGAAIEFSASAGFADLNVDGTAEDRRGSAVVLSLPIASFGRY